MPEFDMTGYRRIEKVDVGKKVCNDPGEPPQIVMLRPSQLVVNEEYQRSLSKNSLDQIKRMAHEFDWDKFKVPNVARTEDPEIYEVVDGQHTAIAAITNGRVPVLPCLLQKTSSLKEKAAGFIGINTQRTALTPVQIFHAKVAAQDDEAIAVECAMSRAGVTLLPLAHMDRNKYAVGETTAIGSMMQIAKRSGDTRLSTILRIAVLAGAAPVSAMLIKALDLCVPVDHNQVVNDKIVQTLIKQGIGRLEVISHSEAQRGQRSFQIMADKIAGAARIEYRLGRARAMGRR